MMKNGPNGREAAIRTIFHHCGHISYHFTVLFLPKVRGSAESHSYKQKRDRRITASNIDVALSKHANFKFKVYFNMRTIKIRQQLNH